MPNFARFEQQLTATLGLARRPVAVAYRVSPPAGVPPLGGAQPSSCAFWRLAAAGRTFYTLPADHSNCPIGSYTQNMPLPPGREAELGQMLAWIDELGYLRPQEVPGLPRLPEPPGVAVYAPLADAPTDPDVVLLSGRPGRLMLLLEAATRAGTAPAPMLGRPTCTAIPAALSAGLASSLGCIGNRVYTDLPDDELYVVIKGTELPTIVGQLETIASANLTLARFHGERRVAR